MRVLIPFVMVLVLAAPACAQDWFWGATWGLSLPAGTTRDYIGEESWRNFGIEGRRFANPHTSFGLSFNWSVFNEVTSEATQIPGGAISGVQYRYINAFPLLATAHYYLGDDERVQVYFGVGAGTIYLERRTEVGLYAVTSDNWHIAVAPEVGLIVPLGWRVKGFLMGRYNWAAEADGFEYSWMDIRIGVVSM